DGAEEVGNLRCDGADLNQLLHRERNFGEFADRQQRTVDRDRWDHGIDAAAVGKARIDGRLRLVDTAADRRDDLVDDPDQVPVVLELDRRHFELAFAFHEDILVGVDEDVRYGWILQQRL